MSDWRIKTPDWRETDVQILQYAVEHGGRLHEHTADMAERISSRGFTLLSILLPAASVSLWLLFNTTTSGNESLDPFAWRTVVLATLTLLPLLAGCVILIFPRHRIPKGRSPSLVLKEEIVSSSSLTGDQLYKAMLISEAENLDASIKSNQAQNRKRLWLLKGLIIAIMAWFILAFALLCAAKVP